MKPRTILTSHTMLCVLFTLSCQSKEDDTAHLHEVASQCSKEGLSTSILSMSSQFDSEDKIWTIAAMTTAQVDEITANVMYSINDTHTQFTLPLAIEDGWSDTDSRWVHNLSTDIENYPNEAVVLDPIIFIENRLVIEYTAYSSTELLDCRLLGNDEYYYQQNI